MLDRDLEKEIKDISYTKLGKKTMICLITTNSGFEIIGTAACVNPSDFNIGIGEQEAYKVALSNLESYEGYRKQISDVRAFKTSR